MRLIVVSNRLPVVLEREPTGWKLRGGSGGLVAALLPILRECSGVWVGWPGTETEDAAGQEAALNEYGAANGFELRPVPMTRQEIEGFYEGFSNEIIWPLFHDFQSHCNFSPDFWRKYLTVKERYAKVVFEALQPDDFVWVHDYHLMGLARQLRAAGVRNRLGFFLHIPFPHLDLFSKLPWRTEVLEGLLQYDLIGFQTPHDEENFRHCVRRLVPQARLRRKPGGAECRLESHVTRIGAFPIGIDFEKFAQSAASPKAAADAARLRAQLPGQQIILGLDRLDYTKGIPLRLRALRLALQRFPELQRRVTLLQVVVPSRGTVPEYQEFKTQVEQLVSQINGEFTQPGWVPIQHVYRHMEWDELIAYYRAADVGLVTPLKDGMNLVSKEYCACQVEGDGVLVLSEFAGAAVQLGKAALLVNPYDLNHVSDAIRAAVSTPRPRRRRLMRRLRRIVQREDVYWWAARFLGACGVDSRFLGRVQAARSRPESRALAAS